jgi:hypothetical protein
MTLPNASKSGIGPIVGGTIGGCVVLSIVAIVAFFVYRRRKIQRESVTQPALTQFAGVTEYNPNGFPSPYTGDEYVKSWTQSQQHQGPVQRFDDAMPQYPRMGVGRVGVVEVDGLERPVEAPGDEISWQRAHVR